MYARVKPRYLDRFERQHGVGEHANWHQLPGNQRALVPLQAWPTSHLASTHTRTQTRAHTLLHLALLRSHLVGTNARTGARIL